MSAVAHPDVAEANARFYRAFEARDVAEIDKAGPAAAA